MRKFRGAYRYRRNIWAVRYDRRVHRWEFVDIRCYAARWKEWARQGFKHLDGIVGKIESMRFIEV